ncbi:MAG: hypothetical protein ACU837_08595 [Gammaproteobacteria bacterium]
MQIKLLLTVIILGLIFIIPEQVFYAGLWVVVHGYELLEFILDEGIAHLFHTSHHTTQIIVFYIMMVLFAIGLYGLLRKLQRLYRTLISEYSFGSRIQNIRKYLGLYHLKFDRRIKIISGFTVGAFVLLFW